MPWTPLRQGRGLERAASGAGIASIALAGYWSHPWVLFGAGICPTTSAIIGKGLWDVLMKLAAAEVGTNIAFAEPAEGGVTAGATVGTVLSGACRSTRWTSSC